MATGGPLAWGLCYNKEMSPSKLYCDDYYKYTYPCTPGVSYHGRGALPIYWYVPYSLTYVIQTCLLEPNTGIYICIRYDYFKKIEVEPT